jgi:predicted AAA+ superfamily ATPase
MYYIYSVKRTVFEELIVWKNSENRKPLVIRGARQVGKTWLLKAFGAQEYENCAYINFESSASLKSLFEADYNLKRILTAIQIESGQHVEEGKTLIIFDEIQEAPGAITSLKYFHENAPEYHIVAAGSLLGVALSSSTSFPVGKVDFMDLHPLSFNEFLEALGDLSLCDLLNARDWALITTFKNKFIDRLKQYYFVGGMPEAVLAFSKRTDFNEVRQIQRNILMAYEQDFSKHAPFDVVPRIRMLWNSVPSQLAKENKKFIYGLIKHGSRAKDYEIAMTWLLDCGLIYKVHSVSKPAIPLKAYENLSAFKLFIVDVGLLAALSALDARTLLSGNLLFEEFKGALTEQYVLQQLIAGKSESIYYWSAENMRSEIDFVIQQNGGVVPIEVKAAENLHAKSLRVFCEKFKPAIAIRTSMSDYREESWMTNWPLYSIASILK